MATRSQEIIEFIETFLVIPEGAHVGRPVRLRPWQRDIIRQIYDTPTRQAIVSMGRKNAKTALISMLVLVHVVGPESRRNSQIFSAAQSHDQASIVFRLAAKMARMGQLNSPDVIVIRDHRKEIFSPITGALYCALSADAKTKFGLSPCLVIHDELGQVRGPTSDLYDSLESAMGAHDDPLSLIISTQAPTDSDLLSMLIDYAATKASPLHKLVLFTAPKEAELEDEATWRLANPAMGDFLNTAEIRQGAEKAARMPSYEPTFRNLHLNQRISPHSALFSPAIWELNGGEPDLTAFEDCPVYGGLDLSSRQDLTSLVLVAERPAGHWNVIAYFWTPADTLADREARDKAPYAAWAAAGLLTAIPGVTVDYSFVAHRLGEIKRRCRQLTAIRFDRWRIDELKAACLALGVYDLPLEEHGQGFRDMAPALDALETVALQGRMYHGMHPVLTMCIANAVVVHDAAGNRKLDKGKATGRIDGAQSLTMAIGRAVSNTTRALEVLIA